MEDVHPDVRIPGHTGMCGRICFFAEYNSYRYGGFGFDPSAITGIYIAITLFQMGLLLFILPVFTATSISGERERQTLDLLLCTDISPWTIIFGKMSAALSFVFLLIVAALPFTGIMLLFGGVTILDLVKIILFYMATAVMVSSIGMFCTVRFKKNITSIVMSYIILGLVVMVPLVLLVILMVIGNGIAYNQWFDDFMNEYAYEVMIVMFSSNPFFGMVSILTSDTIGGDIFSFIGMATNASKTWMRHVQPWMACLVYYTGLSTVMLMVSKRLLVKLK